MRSPPAVTRSSRDACEGPGCTWSYATLCTTSQPTTCNGREFDSDGGTAGDQDAVATTGAFGNCNVSHGGAEIFDLSGKLVATSSQNVAVYG